MHTYSILCIKTLHYILLESTGARGSNKGQQSQQKHRSAGYNKTHPTDVNHLSDGTRSGYRGRQQQSTAVTAGNRRRPYPSQYYSRGGYSYNEYQYNDNYYAYGNQRYSDRQGLLLFIGNLYKFAACVDQAGQIKGQEVDQEVVVVNLVVIEINKVVRVVANRNSSLPEEVDSTSQLTPLQQQRNQSNLMVILILRVPMLNLRKNKWRRSSSKS